MHIYSIGYGTYEESEYEQFYHQKKYTKSQLSKLVHKAVTKVLEDMMKDKPSYVHEDGPTFQDIFHKVCEKLESMGFERVKFDAEWKCFGWSSLCIDNWKGQDDSENIAMRKAIPKKLRASVMELAKKTRSSKTS